jgi:ferredoxin, 2Fe-2S
MPKVTYVEPGGAEKAIEVPEGWTVMQGAIANGVAGIDAECGGSCACGTCHVYVDDAFIDQLTPPDAGENDMLDTVAAEIKPGSRLSCQIKVTAALEGIKVRIPATQG